MPTRKASAANDDGVPARKRTKIEPSGQNDEGDDDSNDSSMNLSQNPDFPVAANDETSEAGIIERIKVTNFLCHSVQDISFGPRINFIIGNNGSGKSAIMTAVIVGLGGKATATSRGSSVKNFIMHNKNSAEIMIKLRNRGQDAFKPEEYGDSIIVERKLNRDCLQGPYRLKNAAGKVVSSKKEELVHMLDQFNIQVDNPVSVLTQDCCKNFLHSKSGHDKYMFFMRATQLEQMRQDYQNANQYKERHREILTIKLQMLPDLEKEVKEWEEKSKVFEAIEGLRKKVDSLKDEMAWAIVTEKERAIDPFRKEFKTQEARTPKFDAKVLECENKVATCMARKTELEEKLKQMSEDVDEMVPKYNEMKVAKDDKKKTFRQKQGEVQNLERDLKRLQKDKESTQERILEIQNSIQKDFEAKKRVRDDRVAQLEAQLAEVKAQLKTTEHVMGQFKAAVAKNREDISRLRGDERDINTQKERLSRELRDLQRTRSNKLGRFGEQMPELVRQIDEACRRGLFHQKPRGPIGACLNLKEQRWAVAVEVCLGGMLHAFCVNDHHDEKQLEKIMRQVYARANKAKPAVITSRFINQLHDVRKNKPRTKFSTVLDMLDQKDADPVVMNCLIDQLMIESVLLIPTTAEVREFTNEASRAVKSAYTLDGDQAFFHPSLRYYSLPQERTYTVLTSNLEESIRAMKQRQAHVEQSLVAKQQEVRDVEREMRDNSKQDRVHHTEANRHRDHLARVNFEIQELKSAEDEAPPDVTTLEEDVERYEEQMQSIRGHLEHHNNKLNSLKEEFEEAERVFKAVDQEVRKITSSTEPVQEEISRCREEHELAKKHRKHYVDKKKEHENKLKELKKGVDAREKLLQESVSKAEAICERKRTRRTAQNIESEITQIEKRINSEERTRGNQDEIMRRYTDTYDALQKIKADVSRNKKLIEQLDVSLLKRGERYIDFLHLNASTVRAAFFPRINTRKLIGKLVFKHSCQEIKLTKIDQVMVVREQNFFHFRKIIALRCKYHFITSIGARNYNGKLSFDHVSESLVINVQPTAESQQNGGSKDMRSLSGGERSFSTVCFVLALWDAIESPFRMLDEFDVYMDMVNRRIAMEMLVQATANSNQRKRQFVFLTPQDMSYIPLKDVRIFRMNPPIRGQGTLNFAPATTSSNDTQDSDDE